MNIRKLGDDIITLIIAMILGVIIAVVVYITLLSSLILAIWPDIVDIIYATNKKISEF